MFEIKIRTLGKNGKYEKEMSDSGVGSGGASCAADRNRGYEERQFKA